MEGLATGTKSFAMSTPRHTGAPLDTITLAAFDGRVRFRQGPPALTGVRMRSNATGFCTNTGSSRDCISGGDTGRLAAKPDQYRIPPRHLHMVMACFSP
jgi:hypothetical protein